MPGAVLWLLAACHVVTCLCAAFSAIALLGRRRSCDTFRSMLRAILTLTTARRSVVCSLGAFLPSAPLRYHVNHTLQGMLEAELGHLAASHAVAWPRTASLESTFPSGNIDHPFRSMLGAVYSLPAAGHTEVRLLNASIPGALIPGEVYHIL